jgi:hypothetical protein
MKTLFKNGKELYHPIEKTSDKFWKWLCTNDYYLSVIKKRAKNFLRYRENTTDSAVTRSVLKLVLPRKIVSKRVSKFIGRFRFYGWWIDCQMGDCSTHSHGWPIMYYQDMITKAKYFSIDIYLSQEEEKLIDPFVELKITSLLIKIDENIYEFKYSWGDNINWVGKLYFDGSHTNQGKVEIYFD